MYTKETNQNTTGKNVWTLFLFMLAGVVFGGFMGNTLGQLPYMSWLSYSSDFGMDVPMLLDFGIVIIQFALLIKFNIGAIIGMVLSTIFYRKL